VSHLEPVSRETGSRDPSHQRWALSIELNCDISIAIRLRKTNRNISLAKLSDVKYPTSKTG
jgi:hypothetical protein